MSYPTPCTTGASSPRVADPSVGRDFDVILRSLAAIHEQQQAVIRNLTDENETLRTLIHGDDTSRGPSKASTPRVISKASVLHRHSEDDAPRGPSRTSTPRVTPRASMQHRLTEDDMPRMEIKSSMHKEYTEQPDEQQPFPVAGDSMPADSGSEGDVMDRCSASPMHWYQSEVWPEWRGKSSDKLQSSTFKKMCFIEASTGQPLMVAPGYLEHIVVRPNSIVRLVWDFLSSLMVCYDVMTIPLMAFWISEGKYIGQVENRFMGSMDWATTCFWSVDIPCSFLTGFHVEGVVEMRPKAIARHYLRTWFLFDFIIIIIDWSILYEQSVGREADALGIFRFGKMPRFARILRTVRLLRFIKLQRALVEALDVVNSESIRVIFNVTLAVLFIITLSHYIACGWFFVGSVGIQQHMDNWIEDNPSVDDGHLLYRYLTALHWSLTQFTPASMEVHARNWMERLYTIFSLLFALVAFSSFLGSISAWITQLRKWTSESGKQQHVLRVYFSKNQVSSELSRAIWTFLNHNHFAHQTRSHRSQIGILTLLPRHLQSSLSFELYGPYITRLPFFYHYTALGRQGLGELCCQATTEKTVVCSEDLFHTGQLADRMFFLVTGFLRYDHEDHFLSTTLGKGSWVTEPVLWVKWVHCANLHADTSSEIIELHSAKFRSVITGFTHPLPYVKRYANLFVTYMAELGDAMRTDVLSDVPRLEAMARQAWRDVTSEKDHALLRSMPSKDFPRWSRSRRLQSLVQEHKHRDSIFPPWLQRWFSVE